MHSCNCLWCTVLFCCSRDIMFPCCTISHYSQLHRETHEADSIPHRQIKSDDGVPAVATSHYNHAALINCNDQLTDGDRLHDVSATSIRVYINEPICCMFLPTHLGSHVWLIAPNSIRQPTHHIGINLLVQPQVCGVHGTMCSVCVCVCMCFCCTL